VSTIPGDCGRELVVASAPRMAAVLWRSASPASSCAASADIAFDPSTCDPSEGATANWSGDSDSSAMCASSWKSSTPATERMIHKEAGALVETHEEMIP